MRVLIQWATSTATDWVAYDITRAADVRALPKKPSPTDSSVLDGQPGWIAAVNIQGIEFAGFDHIGFGISGTALVVTCWNDDPADYPAGTRWGQVWTLDTPAPDPRFGGQVNTRQTLAWYCEANSEPVLAGITGYQPFTAMPIPAANNTIHGVWVSDTQWDTLRTVRTPHGWREWVGN